MIQELVNKIAAAEQQADEMIAAALEEAKAMNFHAETEAAKILADAKARVKSDRKKVAESAEKLAEQRYDEIVKIGESEADSLIANINIKEEGTAVAEAYLKLYER
ncbi:MAG: hypothetical protein PHI19_06325 [Clostridia bacterium]|nr:hypothetical protein [Clostridia bacterium]